MENKNLILLSFLSIILLLVAGCSQGQLIDDGGIVVPGGDGNNQIANPASEYCIQVGGSLKLVENDLGEHNLCILKTGEEIEEWEYFKSQNTNSENNGLTETEKSELLSCKSWNDGCNTCFVTDGQIGGCTLMACPKEMMTEPKCLLFNDEKVIGKILEIKNDEIHILQGDIVEIYQSNNLDISQFKIDDTVEAIFNRNSEFKNLLSTIKIWVNEEKESFICTREYMPVCAQTTIDGNGLPVLETFSNSCMAQNAQIVHQGVCGDDSWQAAEMRICTMEYAPVCATFNGEPKTFGNACGAKGLDIISQGECQ